MVDIVTSRSLTPGESPFEGFTGFPAVRSGSGGRSNNLDTTSFSYNVSGLQGPSSTYTGTGAHFAYESELLAGGQVATLSYSLSTGGVRGNPPTGSSVSYYGLDATVGQIQSSAFWDTFLDGDDTILVDFSRYRQPFTIQTGSGDDRVIEGQDSRRGVDFTNRSASDAIDLGAGNDVLEIFDSVASFSVTLGSGADTILQSRVRNGEGLPAEVVVKDFDAEDRIEIRNADGSVFEGGYLAFIDGATRLIVGSQSFGFKSLFVLQGVALDEVEYANGVISGTGSTTSPAPHPDGPIRGTSGDDILTGTYDRDIIDALSGNDTVFALGGDDLVRGRAGNDTIDGGAGSDVLFGDGGNDVIFGGTGDDAIDGGHGHDELYGGEGNDAIDGGQQGDVIFGGNGNDTIIGGGGDDTLFGENGDDSIDGGHGHDTIDGGFGNDLIFGGSGNDLLYGGSGDDRIIGGSGNDNVIGHGGNDELRGHGGDDAIDGGIGNDLIVGDGGNDRLFGSHGHDRVFGGLDDDVLFGGVGNDRLEGQNGNDVVRGGGGWDRIGGGQGNDLLFGENGHDSLWGGADNDVLNGGAHNDGLHGGAGNDQLIGGSGDDYLRGGTGDDLLDGGAGSDVFRFDPGFGLDVVYGFTSGEDRLSFGDPHLTADIFLANTFETFNGLVFDAGNGNVLSLVGVTLDTFDTHTDLILG